ncbi:extracellular solute-binding protein [Rhizobium leguminosarum bv. viciae]|nr:extracellular solute-binding protein [Rhizobium leguminosarum bv. viciae]
MTMKRRTLLKSAGTLALAAPFISSARAAQAVVTLAGYGGLFRDRYQAAVLDPFQKANPDIRVEYYQVNNSAQNLGTLRGQKAAPQIDLSILDVTIAKGGTDEQIFKPVTAAQVPAIADLHPQAIIKGVAGPGVTFDSLEIVYAVDRVPKKPTSWAGLSDPVYLRQIGVGGVPSIESIGMMMLMSGQKGKISDYDAAVEAGFKAMEKIAPNVLTWDPRPDAGAFVLGGAASVGIIWNARAQSYVDQSGGKLAVADASEGTTLQINAINLVNGAPQEEAALKFMNYALGQEAQKAFTEAMFYAPTNAKAQIKPEVLARTVAAPEKMARVVSVDWIKIAGIRDAITQQWRRRIAAQ